MRIIPALCLLLLTAVNDGDACSITTRVVGDTSHPGNIHSTAGPEAKWIVFWKTSTAAIDARDTATISQLTSSNFYDGGGSTVQQWLQSDVYASEKTLSAFKTVLKKGVKNYKGFDPGPYKATGKNTSGDYFFEYKKGQWLFGGVVGD